MIDGVLPRAWRGRLLDETHDAILRFDRTGLSRASLREGTVGGEARVLGAALLPLQARFAPEPDLLINRRRAQAAARPSPLDPPPAFDEPSPHLDRWRS